MTPNEAIEHVLDEVRPTLQGEGGDVEFVDFDVSSGVLQVRLQGLCSACSMSAVTLKTGIERVMKQRVPEVLEVRRVD